MKKAPEAFRTISEVSDLLKTPQHILRFWETKFYQIRPVKRAGGRRYYRPDDVALLNGLRILLNVERQSIPAVQRMLQEKGARHVQDLGADLPLPDVDEAPRALPAPPERTRLAVTPRPAPPAPPPPPAPAEAAAVAVAQPPTPEAAETEPTPPPGPRLPQLLRQAPREALRARRDRLQAVARRIDALLDRMSEASGAGRW